MELDIRQVDNAVLLPVKVVPGSSRSRIAGRLGHVLKVNVAAAPEKGKANKELIRFLAGLLKRPKSAFSIQSGPHQAHKQIRIEQMTPTELSEYLKSYINS